MKYPQRYVVFKMNGRILFQPAWRMTGSRENLVVVVVGRRHPRSIVVRKTIPLVVPPPQQRRRHTNNNNNISTNNTYTLVHLARACWCGTFPLPVSTKHRTNMEFIMDASFYPSPIPPNHHEFKFGHHRDDINAVSTFV